ncbi:DoxX family protein [Chitinimonas sp.]|uniref:DoxX family protein n=1 Tax=Chitinimonas sp. TaxID=1934313 RepID=UPI0035B110A6
MSQWLHNFPFIAQRHALLLLRLALAAVYAGHAVMRLVTPGYFSQIGGFLAGFGLPYGQAIAWLVTAFELIGAPLLLLDRGTRWVASGLFLISAGSMLLVQSHAGWWVAEYGDGGMEFSFVQCALCLFLASQARTSHRAAQPGSLQWHIAHFPYVKPQQGYAILRTALALFFMIHAASRFTEADYFKGLGIGLSEFGMPFAYQLGIAATCIELVGGSLLILNRFAKWVALGMFGISTVGIVFIHLKLGWFVGEFGNGGAEFSVMLCAICLAIAAIDRDSRSGKRAPSQPLTESPVH